MPSIAVLGLGNTVMRDDGVGARALDELSRRYALPPMVRLIDSAAPMARVMAELEGVDHLIVVDAVRGGQTPGTVYGMGDMGQLGLEQLVATGRSACSSHGVGLADLCALLAALGRCPEVRIIGVEAGELDGVGLELSGPVAAALPLVVAAVVEALRRLGVAVEEREAACPGPRVASE
jgi:hydrogenase maturation protease